MTQTKYSIPDIQNTSFELGSRFSVAYDSNSDGLTDVVIATWEQNKPTRLILFQQDPAGEFKYTNAFEGYEAMCPIIKVDDINKDGVEDLVIFELGVIYDGDTGFTGQEPRIFLGSKNGIPVGTSLLGDAYTLYSAQDSWQTDEKVSAKDFAIADIDNDGDLDIWVESTGGMNTTHHFLINNNSTFSVNKDRIRSKVTGSKDNDYFRYRRAHFEDLNNDGFVDLIFAQLRDDHITHIDGSSIVLLNDGNGFFDQSQNLPQPFFNEGFSAANSISTGDINKDGLKDIVIAHERPGTIYEPSSTRTSGDGNFIQVLIQSKEGSFTDETNTYLQDQSKWETNSPGPYTNPISNTDFFDINQDGWDDLLINYWNNQNVAGPTILLNKKGEYFEQFTPNTLKAYDGENNFFWNKERLKDGKLEAYTQIWDEEILFTDTLFERTEVASSSASVNRLFNVSEAKHLFSSNQIEIDILTGSGWLNEGTVYNEPDVATADVFRFYIAKDNRHFYTALEYERELIINNKNLTEEGWQYEGKVFSAYSTSDFPGNAIGVVRYLNKGTGSHLYSTSTYEQTLLDQDASWLNEGIAWYGEAAI